MEVISLDMERKKRISLSKDSTPYQRSTQPPNLAKRYSKSLPCGASSVDSSVGACDDDLILFPQARAHQLLPLVTSSVQSGSADPVVTNIAKKALNLISVELDNHLAHESAKPHEMIHILESFALVAEDLRQAIHHQKQQH